VRTFDTGATRDSSENKPDYEGFLSPLALIRFGEYMLKHQVQADGTLRSSENWRKGIPRAQYLKSAWRHFVQWWSLTHSSSSTLDQEEEALCALLFNVQGALHEAVREREGLWK
jgi:hypothetical protein